MKAGFYYLFLFYILISISGYSQISGISSSNLPLVIINTNGKTILDAAKIPATMKIIYNGAGKVNKPTDAGNIYNGNIGIEIHGTYSASLPQKPYGIETRDQSGNNRDVSLLGMPEENDWILTANYNDKTFMRNVLAFELFRKMGHYAPRTRLVEAIINNEYMGVYVLTEKIKQDKGRVNIAKLSNLDNSGDAITGGYLFKIDYYDQWNSWKSKYTSIDHPEKVVNYVYADPAPEKLTLQQKYYLTEAVNSFETVLYSSTFTDKTKGYPAWIDANSFIDYFIVSEVSRNVDGFKKSVYFFKDRNSDGGFLHAGPVWDFDWAWKNIWDCPDFQATNGSGWTYKINDCNNSWPNSNGWTVRLLQDPNFANSLNKRYYELRNSFLSFSFLNSFIDSVQNLANEAQQRHYGKWNILSQSVGAPEVDSQPSTYTGQVAKFRNWIQTRLTWLDANMPGKTIPTLADEFQTTIKYRIFPNPASGVVFIETSSEIQDIEVFHSSGLRVIHQFGISGFETKLDVSALSPGIYLVRLKLKGKPSISSNLLVQ